MPRYGGSTQGTITAGVINNMKILSVLIAAFDAKNWLADCLDSVFSQELPPGWQIQVLLGVDGCDETLKCACAFNYPELTIIHLTKNQGTYVTFNTLMRYAKGELICRFDADDVMKPGYFTEQIPLLETRYDVTRTWSIYSDEALQPTSHVLAHKFYHPEGGLNRRPADGQFIARREVMETLGGFRAWRCGADTEFFKRSRIAGYRTGVVEQFLYLRRIHKNSLTAHPDTNFSSSLRLSLEKKVKDFEQQYRKGQLSLKVEAEYANAHVVL
ncbi:glycosyltransferase family 2 protein [Thalassomonas actiniarum]|uniref:Glycosyltransferase family 2 protein n=2 Tax=Thalassomonas actiniarum TaxID=485447 RepID=A0AAE9YTT3_9GAMM|nr:glycosyltransferase family 2 protein [Thalassomonas actiniarum]